MDKHFRVEVLEKTFNPQRLIWIAMHQCVCEGAAIDDKIPSEDKSGESIVKNLLAGNRGHYSPFEAPQISFNVINFPHSVIQQVTRHRVGVHYSIQSMRYTGKRIYNLGVGFRNAFESGVAYSYNSTIEGFEYLMDDCDCIFYLRPVGHYADRQGKKYEYSQVQRNKDLKRCLDAALHYANLIDDGFSEEHARGLIPFDIRQHGVMSFNVRSLMHVLDLRSKADAQLECQWLCDLIWRHFEEWVPAIAEWYEKNRLGKARLAP